ncbi:hypothetical protein C8F04DRAFT_1063918 [Mycena alexandri]|uniref:Uncharacterized protein n=1 Tax=Mycena alexandri TaxID=1745969 RepID=A0AAD6TII6_9AGAR|nr:hypothetical protein C8F04DRAFT_1063918 [Mycena alexandri]
MVPPCVFTRFLLCLQSRTSNEPLEGAQETAAFASSTPKWSTTLIGRYALANNGPFVSQAVWYHDNVDIVDYTIIQALELYKGRSHDLRRTHAVVFWLTWGPPSERNRVQRCRGLGVHGRDRLDLSPVYLNVLGSGSRITLVFIPNSEDSAEG